MADNARGTETLEDHHLTEVNKDFFFDGMLLPVAY